MVIADKESVESHDHLHPVGIWHFLKDILISVKKNKLFALFLALFYNKKYQH